MRSPRFTFVSEGKPLRRLLVISKAGVVVDGMECHTASEVWVSERGEPGALTGMGGAVGWNRTSGLRVTSAPLCN